MEYIHYGSSRFDPYRWMDVHNDEDGFNKPIGGLWASPNDAKRGWREWCISERFHESSLQRGFRFTLSPTARILELTPENVWDLPSIPDYEARYGERSQELFGSVRGIDFESLSEKYDVLLCNITEHPNLYWSLYGWDCDCILVLNKDVIVEV